MFHEKQDTEDKFVKYTGWIHLSVHNHPTLYHYTQDILQNNTTKKLIWNWTTIHTNIFIVS